MNKEKAIKTKREKKPLDNKKKSIIFCAVSFIASFSITTLIILTFAVFIPQAQVNEQKKQYDNAVSLLDSGSYEEAASYLKDLNYGDSQKLYCVAQAGKFFTNGDYESGIENIHSAGGSVDVYYDPNGGTVTNNREVLNVKKKWINNNPIKNGYDFIKWDVSSFTLSYGSRNYAASLKLFASWNIVNYSITYNLNGGSLDNLPTSYTVDTPTIELGSPIKKGYTFIGWSGTGIEEVMLDVSIAAGSVGDRNYTANYQANQYTITYNYAYDGLSDTQTITYDTDCSLIEPSREGYTFDGWYFNGQKLENGKWTIDSDAVLIAKWTINTYRLNFFNPNEERGSLIGSGSYNHGTEVTVTAVANPGYDFLGWYINNELVSEIETYTFIVTSDTTLSVRWSEAKTYTVTLDPDGGDVFETTTKVQCDHNYLLVVPTKIGYEFDGWSDGTDIIPNSGIWRYDSDKNLIAVWSIANYVINYNLDGGTNNANNPETHTYFDDVILNNPEKEGYQFDGWYLNNTKIDKIEAGNNEEISLEARWIPLKNTLVVSSEDTSRGTVSIQSGSGYSGENIVVNAEPLDGYLFSGWDDGSSIVSNQETYSFTMPPYDYTLTARFVDTSDLDLGVIPTYEGNTISYGLYPQTHVNNPDLIANLQAAPVDHVNGWTKYNNKYYCNATSLYNDGFFDDGVEFHAGFSYWFECEPIKWKVIYETNSSTSLFVVSQALLDAQTFTGDQFVELMYEANYAESDIRTWLNNYFFNTAFALSATYIRTTDVDNSAITTDNSLNDNCCEDTLDNVFLGSYKDYTAFGSEEYRKCYLTDFARIRNDVNWDQDLDEESNTLKCYAPYFTRSPVSQSYDKNGVWVVKASGLFTMTYTNRTNGIRPWIQLAFPFGMTEAIYYPVD